MRKMLEVGEGSRVGGLEKETLMEIRKTAGRLDIQSVKRVGDWRSLLGKGVGK